MRQRQIFHVAPFIAIFLGENGSTILCSSFERAAGGRCRRVRGRFTPLIRHTKPFIFDSFPVRVRVKKLFRGELFAIGRRIASTNCGTIPRNSVGKLRALLARATPARGVPRN